MKTYALVAIEDVVHETDSMEHVKALQQEAADEGNTLILVKPMETNINLERRAARERGKPKTQAPWSMIMSALDNLRAEVASLRAEVGDSVGKFNTLAEKLANAASAPNNEAEIQAIADELKGITAGLDAATADAKPVEPAPAEPAAEPTP